MPVELTQELEAPIVLLAHLNLKVLNSQSPLVHAMKAVIVDLNNPQRI